MHKSANSVKKQSRVLGRFTSSVCVPDFWNRSTDLGTFIFANTGQAEIKRQIRIFLRYPFPLYIIIDLVCKS